MSKIEIIEIFDSDSDQELQKNTNKSENKFNETLSTESLSTESLSTESLTDHYLSDDYMNNKVIFTEGEEFKLEDLDESYSNFEYSNFQQQKFKQPNKFGKENKRNKGVQKEEKINKCLDLTKYDFEKLELFNKKRKYIEKEIYKNEDIEVTKSDIENECMICMEKYDDILVCFNPYCNNKICKECVEELIDINIKEKYKKKFLPKCFNCDEYMVYHTINDKKLLEKISKCLELEVKENVLFEPFKKDFEELIRKNEIFNRIRQTRREFIETIPKAVRYIIENFMENKIKLKPRKTKSMLNKTFDKKCFYISCKGKLDKNNECDICLSKFCIYCEKEFLDKNHVCDENNEKSLQFINNNLSKCGNCGVFIEKSEGCNNMTCELCGYKFNYLTGEKSESGNHSTKLIDYDRDKKLFIHKEYNIKNKKLYTLIEKFELDHKEQDLKEILKNIIFKYANGEITINKFYFDFSEFIIIKNKNAKYYNIITNLESDLKKNKNIDYYGDIINKYNVFFEYNPSQS